MALSFRMAVISKSFVHIKAFANRRRRPVGNELLTYELAVDRQGRKRAENVAFADERKQRAGNAGKPGKGGICQSHGRQAFWHFYWGWS